MERILKKSKGAGECTWPQSKSTVPVGEERSSRPPGALFLGLAALAERHDFRWVDGIVVDLQFDDFAALVDQIVDAASCFVLGIVKSVLAGDIPSPVAQQGKSDGDFFCPRGVAEGAIHAYTQYLGVGSFQLLQVLLEVLHLLGSTNGESEDVKGEGDVLLAAEVMQGHRVAMGVHEGKIRRHVPDLNGGIGQDVFLLRLSPQPIGGRWCTQSKYPKQKDRDTFAHASYPPSVFFRVGPRLAQTAGAMIAAMKARAHVGLLVEPWVRAHSRGSGIAGGGTAP